MEKGNHHEKLLLAEKNISKGNIDEALVLLQKLCEAGCEAAREKYQHCVDLRLRKAWGKGEVETFELLTQGQEKFALPLARLKGTAALEAIAAQSMPEGELASYSLQGNVKNALLTMRRNPPLKAIAEGWLALLKGDHQHAFSRFSEAKTSQPYRARVGEAAVALCRGSFTEAKDILKPLRRYAKKRLPIVNQCVGWDVGIENDEEQLYDVLTQGSFEQLRSLIGNKKVKKFQLYSWLLLKYGDFQAEKGKPKLAIKYWNEARLHNVVLTTDFLKRRFLLAHQKGYRRDDVDDYLIDLYEHLRAVDPHQATELIETIIAERDFNPLIENLRVPYFDFDSNTWSVFPPPPECVLLLVNTLCMIVSNLDKEIDQRSRMLTHSERLCELNFPPFPFWSKMLKIADSRYGNKISYLKQRYLLCERYSKYKEARETAYKIITIEPLLKDQYIHKWENFAYRTFRSPKMRKELQELAKFLPNCIELARIRIKCEMTTLEEEMGKLSESQAAALRFQWCIDQKQTKDECIAALPEKGLIGRDESADMRILYGLSKGYHYNRGSDEKLKKRLVKAMATSSERMHRVMKRLEQAADQFRGIWIVRDIVRPWVKLFPKHWHPYYYAGILGISIKKGVPPRDNLDKALSLMDGTEEEYHRAQMECHVGFQETHFEDELEDFINQAFAAGLDLDDLDFPL